MGSAVIAVVAWPGWPNPGTPSRSSRAPAVSAAPVRPVPRDVIGLERAAEMMSALSGAPVSTGFIPSCPARPDTALTTAGFEEELKAALREQEVLGTEETPAPPTASGAAAEKDEDCTDPQVFTVRTMRAYTRGRPGDPVEDLSADLVWYGAVGTRTKRAITSFDILDSFCGFLVRDDFGGYISYDKKLAGVRQCLSHYADIGIRAICSGISTTPTTSTRTARRGPVRSPTPCARRSTRSTPPAATTPTSTPTSSPGPGRRHSFDQGVAVGIPINLSWPDASNARSTRCGCSPPAPTSHRRTTDPRPPSAASSLQACRQRCFKRDWIVDLDVKAFFDSVPWDLMLKAVARHTDQKWVMLYVERWFKAPILMPDGTMVARIEGTPQGGLCAAFARRAW